MSASNSRRRIRLTNRSDLRVFRGEEVGELVVLQEEAHQSKTLNADGVELGGQYGPPLPLSASLCPFFARACFPASRSSWLKDERDHLIDQLLLLTWMARTGRVKQSSERSHPLPLARVLLSDASSLRSFS